MVVKADIISALSRQNTVVRAAHVTFCEDRALATLSSIKA